jgi:hypothetical protein
MLANHPEVQARLEEIRAVPVGTRAIAARNKVTPETLIEWQNEVREQGMKSGQLSAASTAIREISILTDHRIERSEIGSPGEFDHLTDDELERVLVQRMAALGLAVEVLPESDTQH